jgi:sugar phosphate isomerase/epimerase
MKVGIVTYNIAAEWDCDTLIAMCKKTGMEGVELRTTHAHKVEVSLTAAQRFDVRRKFQDAGVTLVGLGSVFEYHSPDPQELKRNIDGTKQCVALARDVGAQGVKVRPNGLPAGVPREKTIAQIGRALREVGEYASGLGVKIRLEVHGHDSCHPPAIRQMIDIAGHPNVYVCWNSNMTDLDAKGSIDAHFAMLRDKIEILHINQLWNEYPWERLFHLLKQSGFAGFCLAEIPASADAETVLRYYRRLFNLLETHA